MDDRKRKVFLVITDIVLLGVIIAAVWLLIRSPDSSMSKVYTAVIVLAIPTIFYLTANKVVGDRFAGVLPDEDDEEEAEGEKEESHENDITE